MRLAGAAHRAEVAAPAAFSDGHPAGLDPAATQGVSEGVGRVPVSKLRPAVAGASLSHTEGWTG